jgi:hypothetical protein
LLPWVAGESKLSRVRITMFSGPRSGWIFCVLTLFGTLGHGIAYGADWKILPGHVPDGLERLTANGSVPAAKEMRLAIGLPLRDSAGLERFLAQLYDPTSPTYKKYLSPAQFADRFGPTEQDYEVVKQFARAAGLSILETNANRMVLDVSGPAAAVEQAFHIRLKTYRHPTENRQFFAPDAEPEVSADLPILDLQGLSDFAPPHPRIREAVANSSSSSPNDQETVRGSYIGDNFRNAYVPGTSLTGAGQIVGLLQFDGYHASDVAAYAAAAGGGRATISVETILLDNFNGVPSAGKHSGSVEVSLDIEMAMAMAPGLSRIVVFEAGPHGFANDVLNAMVLNNSIKNLSCSWGWGGGPSATTDNLFKEMAAQGQSFFTASGDNDAFTTGARSVNGVDNPNNPDSPSSSPYITVVGGTTLAMERGGSAFESETVWNWGRGNGSSGGVSSYYAIPSWQSGVSMGANHGSTSQRNIPDVAMTADNVMVYYGNGSVGVFGGTSCAAPLWAGFMALVNQQAARDGDAPAGFINPAIYAIGTGQNASYSYGACFHDVSAGNNFSSVSPSSYSAVRGYDLCTGWGTPKGMPLIDALSDSSASANPVPAVGDLSISPESGFAFSGFMGGPFVPGSGTFVLSNSSAAALSWSLVSTSAWLTVASPRGTVPASSAWYVAVSPGVAANALKPGSYFTSLGYTNLATHAALKIPLRLDVSQPVSISSTQGFVAMGPVGGPFSTPFATTSQSYTLSNASASTMNWGLAKKSSWLTVSSARGSLAPGGQTVVTVSLASMARTLRAAIYNDIIRFTNSGGTIATVPATLSVGQPLVENGGFETGSFGGWAQSGNTASTSVVKANASYSHSGACGAALGPDGAPGYLSQTLPTVAGQSYKLSFWLRNSTGATPNWFQVQWDGSVILDQQNITARGWTNLQFIVTASRPGTRLQLEFQDDANHFSLDDVSVVPVAAPLAAVGTPGGKRASAVVKVTANPAGDFQLAWNTVPGTLYQFQYKTNLCQVDWFNLGGVLLAGSDTVMMTDTNALRLSPQRFYRLLTVTPP